MSEGEYNIDPRQIPQLEREMGQLRTEIDAISKRIVVIEFGINSQSEFPKIPQWYDGQMYQQRLMAMAQQQPMQYQHPTSYPYQQPMSYQPQPQQPMPYHGPTAYSQRISPSYVRGTDELYGMPSPAPNVFVHNRMLTGSVGTSVNNQFKQYIAGLGINSQYKTADEIGATRAYLHLISLGIRNDMKCPVEVADYAVEYSTGPLDPRSECTDDRPIYRTVVTPLSYNGSVLTVSVAVTLLDENNRRYLSVISLTPYKGTTDIRIQNAYKLLIDSIIHYGRCSL